MTPRRPTIALLVAALAFLALPQIAGARTIRVTRGHSIQRAIDRASPGDTVLVDPGTYREPGRPCPTEPDHRCAVVITQDGITLAGRTQTGVVLRAVGHQDEGIAVGKSSDVSCLDDSSLRIDGSVLRNFTVQG